jgi:polygalacturonase
MRTPGNYAWLILWACFALPAVSEEVLHEVKEPTGKAVQLAIDTCADQGGGVAYLPPGRYVTGPLWLKDNVELRVEAGATLVLSPDRKDWPSGVRALVNARGVKNIAITGRGTFDGNAQWEYLPVRGQDRRSLKNRKSRGKPEWR